MTALAGEDEERAALRIEREFFLHDERERVEWLVEKHQVLGDARRLRTSTLKMILVHPGIRELLALHRRVAEANAASA